MATEGQLRALRNWLNRDILTGEIICEMPAEICSSALSQLCAASDARQNGEKNGYIKKTKHAVIAELREQGWIGVPADRAQSPLQQANFGERAETEMQKIKEEQGFAPKPLQPALELEPSAAELITKYVEILSQVTEAVTKEERIPDREKGYAVKFVYDSVKAGIDSKKEETK